MKSGTIVAALALALTLGASLGAQSRKWEEPYRKGIQAFEAGKYAEAREQLERAIAAEPKAEANKLIEGVYRTDYFPYYYLALTFVELQQFDKAQQNLEKARPTVMRWQQARFAEAESKLKNALAPKPPPRNAEFDNGVRDANALLTGKQFDAAIRKFDQLRSADAAEFGKTGLAAKRDEAVKGLAGQLTDEARALIQNGRFRDAAAKLRQADQTLPGQKPVGDLQAEIKKREDDYQRLKTEGQTAFSGKNYTSARDKFDQARQAHPEQFDADNLVARLSEASTLANTGGRAGRGPEAVVVPDRGTKALAIDPGVTEGRRIADLAKRLTAQGKYADADAAYASALKADAKNQEAIDALEKTQRFKALRDQGLQLSKAKKVAPAQKALTDARSVDAARFAREGLASTLEALTAPTAPVDNGPRGNDQDPSKVALRDALLALLNGDPEKSIALLEPTLSTGGDRTASLHAYLGVAYATRSLSAPKPDDQVRLHQKAVEQFKLASSAQPGYRLSDRLVSPAIVKIYEQSR